MYKSLPLVCDHGTSLSSFPLGRRDQIVRGERVESFTDAEIRDFAGLDVLVDDALAVEVVEARDELEEVVLTLPHRELVAFTLVQHVLQDGATVLEHHVDLALLLVVEHVDELHDVLVAELAEEANLALDILLALRVLPQFPLLHNFNGTTTQSLRVNGFLNFSITSLAKNIPHHTSLPSTLVVFFFF